MDPLPDRSAPVHEGQPDLEHLLAGSQFRFHRYDLMEPSERIEDVLDEIDKDPTCIFWG